MEENLDLIDKIQNEIVQKEIIVHDLNGLNKLLNINEEFILLVNIRSLNANHTKLQAFIANLDYKPSIIICSETWNLEYHHYFSLPNYKMYYNNSKINQADGVIVFISEHITESTSIITLDKLSILHSSIVIEKNKKIEISAIYRSHDIPELEFISQINNFLKTKRKIRNHLIAGDFNIDILKTGQHSHEFLNNFLENGFLPGFQTITRPSIDDCTKGTCIDNIYIKTDSIHTKSIKLENLLNDHYPLILQIGKLRSTKADNNAYLLNYSKLGKVAAHENWKSILEIHDPNLAAESLILLITKCMAQSQNVISNKRTKLTPRKTWITKSIILSCNKKETLYNIWKADPANQQKKTNYKEYSKVLDKVIKGAKLTYESKQILDNCTNTRKLWKLINEKIGKNNKKEKIEYIHDQYKNKINNSQTISDTFNSYFCNIGIELSNKIQQLPNNPIKLPPFNDNTIYLYPTNPQEIQTIIKNLKLKSGGIDNINAKTLKTLIKFITDPLVHIINLGISMKVWPDVFKKAEIIPIHKGKEKYIVSNYRPISLISNLAKVFEKIIHHRILNFVYKHKIFSKKQYGFMKKIGTKNALNDLTSLLYKNIDKNNPIAVTFLDLAKAFDTVNHKILLNKLYNYGIRGNAHKLISSYLNNRQQRVKVNECTSGFLEVNTGVPQGTILGPLLFTLYVNDLLEGMPEDSLIAFADDTAIISAGKNWETVESNMNIQLDKVFRWLESNKLSLNVEKTVFMTFGSYCTSVPEVMNIAINNKNLNRVEQCKYLGIVLDYRLTWEKHMDYLINKTKYLVFIFYKLSMYMQIHVLVKIYYALFHSIISYGIIAWGGAYNNNLNTLQRLQTRILKIINKNGLLINYPLRLEQMFAYESLMYHYTSLSKTYTNSKSITRNKSINLPVIKKSILNKNSHIKAIHLFNKLPNSMKMYNNISYKKRILKKWIAENC